ncbi:MAG: universal stress protein [Acidobacteriota bacterium]|nr:universal stress protein [Acidobacteriota bacterium]
MIEINSILCPIDFSAFSERALAYAMKMAVWYGAKLQVLHVMPPLPPSTTSELAETSRQLTRRNLEKTVERYRLPAADVATELMESAEPAARILECADSCDADLIVTGSHGRSGVQRVLLGSVVEPLLHRCSRPVLTVPSHVDPSHGTRVISFSRIVCAIDFSPSSLNALAHALSIAEETNSALTLLHVIEKPPELSHAPQPPDFDVAPIRVKAEAAAHERLRELIPEQARDYCTIETAVLEGGVSRQLLRMASARNADLIVLGVHGRSAFDLAFFGSNSKDVIREAHCPVLVVPASRRRTAVRVAS